MFLSIGGFNMARLFSENPLSIKVQVRITRDIHDILMKLAEEKNVTISELLRPEVVKIAKKAENTLKKKEG